MRRRRRRAGRGSAASPTRSSPTTGAIARAVRGLGRGAGRRGPARCRSAAPAATPRCRCRCGRSGQRRGRWSSPPGAELKNTFALVRDGLAFVSAHVGDLGSLESRRRTSGPSTRLTALPPGRPRPRRRRPAPGYASPRLGRAARRRASACRCSTSSTTTPTSPRSPPSTAASTSRSSGWSSTAPATAATPPSGAASCCCSATAALAAERLGHLGARPAPRRRRRRPQPGAHGRPGDAGRGAAAARPARPVGATLSEADGASSSPARDRHRLGGHQQRRTPVRRGRRPCSGSGTGSPTRRRPPIELEAAARTWRRSSPGTGRGEPLPFPVVTGPSGLPVLDPGPLVRALVTVVRRGRARGGTGLGLPRGAGRRVGPSSHPAPPSGPA